MRTGLHVFELSAADPLGGSGGAAPSALAPAELELKGSVCFDFYKDHSLAVKQFAAFVEGLERGRVVVALVVDTAGAGCRPLEKEQAVRLEIKSRREKGMLRQLLLPHARQLMGGGR